MRQKTDNGLQQPSNIERTNTTDYNTIDFSNTLVHLFYKPTIDYMGTHTDSEAALMKEGAYRKTW